MNKNGPILVIEDDEDDLLLIDEAFKSLGYPNEIRFFADAPSALNCLQTEDINPFLIISDLNMPMMNGFELRDIIQEDKRINQKCIPYVFLSTSADKDAVYQAYNLSAQGYFQKPNSITDLREELRVMVEYWRRCYSPSNFIPH
jgi:CheY-like chemotaxis protein